MDRNKMIDWLAKNVDVWPEGPATAPSRSLPGPWCWSRAGSGEAFAASPAQQPISKDCWKARRGSRIPSVFDAAEIASLLQCKPDEVLDVVRNLVPDWHTVPRHVDSLQLVWTHAQGFEQSRPVFIKRPKAPVDQETVDDLLARFDKDSLQEAFK